MGSLGSAAKEIHNGYTPGYHAPELQTQGVSPATDMFAFGRTVEDLYRDLAAKGIEVDGSHQEMIRRLTAQAIGGGSVVLAMSVTPFGGSHNVSNITVRWFSITKMCSRCQSIVGAWCSQCQ